MPKALSAALKSIPRHLRNEINHYGAKPKSASFPWHQAVCDNCRRTSTTRSVKDLEKFREEPMICCGAPMEFKICVGNPFDKKYKPTA